MPPHTTATFPRATESLRIYKIYASLPPILLFMSKIETTVASANLEKIGYKRIFGIAFPIILSNLAQNVIAIADTIFLGNLGEVELGASALAAIFYQVMVMVIFGFGVGAQILMSRRLGQGQSKSIGCIFQHTLWFTLFCALLLWTLFQIFGKHLLSGLVHSPEILHAVSDYMQVRIYGLFPALAIIAFNAFYVGIAHTRTISIATLIMGVVNVVLDYDLVFGAMGLPRMEMRGAALASVIAEIIGLISYILLTQFSRHRKRYLPFGRFKFQFRLIKNLLAVSYPLMIQHLLSFGNYFLFFLFIEELGQRSLAIANMTRSMYVIFLLPIWGFASTTATLTSYLCGRKRTGEILPVAGKALLLTLLCISMIVGLFFPFRDAVLGIFTHDDSLVPECYAPCLVVIAATYIMAVAQILFNTVLGRGNTKAGFFIETVNMVFYFLYGWIFIHLDPSCSVAQAFGAEITYTVGLFVISLIYIFISRRFGKARMREI